MSTEPHKFWPPVGSVWHHWSDLLLATQLAALRAGFNYVARSWKPRSPTLLRLSCSVRPNNPTAPQCRKSLLVATAVDAARPAGAWEVSRAASLDQDAARHPEHTGRAGLSSPLKKKPLAADPLKAGDIVVGFRAVHTLEGSIRADARRAGRFVTFGAVAAQRTLAGPSASADEPDMAFNCVLRGSVCPFLVRLKRLADSPDDEPRWLCVEIRSSHSCLSDAAPPSKRLKRRLKFFPSIVLQDGYVGKPMKRYAHKSRADTSQACEHIGPFPVRASASTPRPPSPELFDPAYRSPCPSPPPLAARDRKKPKPPAPARTPPAPTSSRSPSPAPARAAPTQSPSPSPAPAPIAPASPPPPPPSRTPSALLARRSASLASATAVLAALEQAVEVQRALVAKKRRSVERAAGKLEVRKKDKVQEVVKQVVKKPGPPRRSRAERKRLKQQREREARERREAE